MTDDVHAAIPREKVSEALRRSPSGYLSTEEIRTAYLDLRKSLSLLLDPPHPVVEEPTGDVLVGFSVRHPQAGTVWSPDDGLWGDGGSDEIPWAQLAGDAKPSDILLYQRVPYPQSDGAGALPTSPSPEVGVATSPPVPSPDIEEPTEQWSLVRATCGGERTVLGRIGPPDGIPWIGEDGGWHAWSELSDIEVLRIGVGADGNGQAYQNGRIQGESHLRSVLLEQITAFRCHVKSRAEIVLLDKVLTIVTAEL